MNYDELFDRFTAIYYALNLAEEGYTLDIMIEHSGKLEYNLENSI